MAYTINLYDYTEIDAYWGETYNCIGMGRLTAQHVTQEIANAKGDELLVRINSVGGSVFDGFAIYNALKSHPAKVTVRIEGLAASIASIISMAGEEIIICQAAMMMVHKPTIDPFWCGAMDADDLQREANALTQIEAVLNDIYTTRTGLGSTKVQKLINDETWITPDVAVTLGFANSIEKTITEQPAIPQNAFNHVFQNANPNIRAYANNAFKVNTMSTPNEALVNAVNKNNTLLDWFKNKFNFETNSAIKNASATLANGNAIYYNDGESLSEGTEVFEDEDQSKPLSDGNYELQDGTKLDVAEGKITGASEEEVIAGAEDSAAVDAKDQRIAELEAQLTTANNAVNSANEILEKLKNTKSSYTPPKAKQEFNSATTEEAATDGKSAVERIRERKNKAK